jgi:hypothetical protein
MQTYTVQKVDPMGGSLFHIAKKFNVLVANLKKWNPGIGVILKPGTVVQLEDPQAAAPTAETGKWVMPEIVIVGDPNATNQPNEEPSPIRKRIVDELKRNFASPVIKGKHPAAYAAWIADDKKLNDAKIAKPNFTTCTTFVPAAMQKTGVKKPTQYFPITLLKSKYPSAWRTYATQPEGPKPGDVILYKKPNGDFKHVAVVIENQVKEDNTSLLRTCSSGGFGSNDKISITEPQAPNHAEIDGWLDIDSYIKLHDQPQK